MPDTERRRAVRRAAKLPLVMMMASGSLDGETIDISRTGVLVRSKGRVTLVLNLRDGKVLRGRLIRATRIDKDTTAYAVQLDKAMSSQFDER